MATPTQTINRTWKLLHRALGGLLYTKQDLDTICKYVPRLANSVSMLAKSDPAFKSQYAPQPERIILEALRDLVEERSENTEEEPTW